MQKIRLGTTDLLATPVCIGASALGDMPDTYSYSVDIDRALATVRAIFDGPINFLDVLAQLRARAIGGTDRTGH